MSCCLDIGFCHMFLRSPVSDMVPLFVLQPTYSRLMSTTRVICVYMLKVATKCLSWLIFERQLYISVVYCLFVLRFYGPVNPMGSCRARSVYLTTRLLGRLSPLSS